LRLNRARAYTSRNNGGGMFMRTRREALYGLGAAAAAVAVSNRAFANTGTPRSAVNFQMPPNACDSHVHIFDPVQFPYVANRVYSPPPALISDLIDLHKDLRIDRVVIVQPSVYGADNACTLDAIRKLGNRARGVAVIDRTTSRAQIDEMHAIGVRGIRLNLNTTPSGEIDAEGSKRTLDTAAEQIRDRGWHIQFYTRPPVIAALKAHIEQLPFPVVFDHFGAPKATDGPNQKGFDALLDLVKAGKAYVKISGAYRVSEKSPDFLDATPLAQALIAANPERIVWGTDWPHPDSSFGRGKPLTELAPPIAVDDGLLLNQLPQWANATAVRKRSWSTMRRGFTTSRTTTPLSRGRARLAVRPRAAATA
jgi:predicted TIM-barrel fold metal-dependent hydrolase